LVKNINTKVKMSWTASKFSLKAAVKECEDSKIENKISELSAKLNAEFEIELRDDSRLTWNWATGYLPAFWDMDRVIHEIVLTHYLYNYTDYPERLKYTIPLIKNHLRFSKGFSRAETFMFVQTYVIASLRMESIMSAKECSFNWPWLTKIVTNDKINNILDTDLEKKIIDENLSVPEIKTYSDVAKGEILKNVK